jgi:HPt (histidine-containing phosphotransfer) domain-containing protein
MSQRLNEYLAREAGDYLEQMDRLLSGSDPVDPEQLLRLARGVRGSAQMAGAEAIAALAERLENAARSVVSQTIPWNGEIRERALQTVRDLQQLLRAVNQWGPEEEARARAAVERWDDLDPRADGPREEEAEIVPIASLFYDDAGPHVLGGPGVAEAEVVDIGTLLFRGEGALREALSMRSELDALLASQTEARQRVAELFDLIELGLSGDAASA